MTTICGGQSQFSTNRELLASAVEEAAAEVVSRLRLTDGSQVSIIEHEGSGDIARFVINRFSRALMDRQVVITYSEDSLHADLSLSITVTHAMIGYERRHEKGLFGGGLIERQAKVGLSIRAIEGKSRQILWIGDIDKNATDRIPYAMLEQVEEGGLLLGKPNRPKDRGVMRWIEPVLVAGAVGSAAYLFYIVRSR
jgi:hypothetical protein